MSATSHRAKSLASQVVIRDLVRRVACVAAIVLGAVMLVAALVAAVASAQARQVIAYQFPAGILGWRGVAVVLLDNARLALAPIAATYLVELIRPLVGKRWSGWRRAVRSGCDAALGGAVLTNVVIAGASYGAYGLKMARYTLPYAPFELLAFACPLALYLAGPPRLAAEGARGGHVRHGSAAAGRVGADGEPAAAALMLALRHRILIALPLMAIAIAAGTYLAAHYGPTLSRELHQSTTARAREAPAGRNAHRHPRVVRPPRAAPHRANASIHTLLVGLAITWTGAIAFAVIGLALTVKRRFANRLRRHYERYPLNLTMHDEAKPKDLDDMIEAIANAIRPPLQTRWRDGQPFIAIELIYRETGHGLEWMLCLLCEREAAPTLEGIIAQAYPDVWLGRRFDEQPSRRRRDAARSRLRAAAAKAPPLSVSAVATDRTHGEPGAQAELAARGHRAGAGRGGNPVDRPLSADAGDRGPRAPLPPAPASTRASRPPLVGKARAAHAVSRRRDRLRGRGAGPRAVSPRASGSGA